MKKILAVLLAAFMLLNVSAFAEEGGRVPAEYSYRLTGGEDQYIENLIFNENVVISGDGSCHIFFINCQFNRDIINTAEEATRVFLLGSEVNGKCILRNSVQETTVDASFPKFLTDSPIEVVTEDCFGAVIALGDFEVTLNGESYDLAHSETFLDPEAGFVPYDGQEANLYCVAVWTENGQPQVLHECEFDPSM